MDKSVRTSVQCVYYVIYTSALLDKNAKFFKTNKCPECVSVVMLLHHSNMQQASKESGIAS